MSTRRWFVLALVCLAATQSAVGRAFHVAPPPTGSDAAAGDLQHPLATIQAGIDKCVFDGDTCYVHAGTYAVTSQIAISGKSAASGGSRAVMAWPADSGRVVIDGSGITGQYRYLLVISSDGWTVGGFEVVNVNGGGLQGWGCNRAIKRGNHVHNCREAGIAIYWNDYANRLRGNVIEDNTVHDCALMNEAHTAGGWPAGVAMQSCVDGAIRRNHVYRIHGEGILTYTSARIVYSDNRVHDTYAANYYLDNAVGSTVERNFGYQTGDPVFNPASPPNGIRPYNNVQLAAEDYGDAYSPDIGDTIRNNVFAGGQYNLYYGNYSRGGGMRSCVIANNIFYGARSATLHLDKDTNTNNRFVNNIMVLPSGTTFLDPVSDLGGFNFDHNGWFGPSAPAALRGTGDQTGPSSAVLFTSAGASVATGYRLSAGSPCIRTGASIPALVRDDFTGAARGAVCDMGAFQSDGTGGVGRRPSLRKLGGVPDLRGAFLLGDVRATGGSPYGLDGRAVGCRPAGHLAPSCADGR